MSPCPRGALLARCCHLGRAVPEARWVLDSRGVRAPVTEAGGRKGPSPCSQRTPVLGATPARPLTPSLCLAVPRPSVALPDNREVSLEQPRPNKGLRVGGRGSRTPSRTPSPHPQPCPRLTREGASQSSCSPHSPATETPQHCLAASGVLSQPPQTCGSPRPARSQSLCPVWVSPLSPGCIQTVCGGAAMLILFLPINLLWLSVPGTGACRQHIHELQRNLTGRSRRGGGRGVPWLPCLATTAGDRAPELNPSPCITCSHFQPHRNGSDGLVAGAQMNRPAELGEVRA